jgi:hypothetical protein
MVCLGHDVHGGLWRCGTAQRSRKIVQFAVDFVADRESGRDVEKVEQDEKEADRMLKDICARLARIERQLEERQSAKD